MLRQPIQQWSCRWRFTRLLSAYLDKELGASETVNVTAHLRDCARCKDELQQLSLSKTALKHFEIPPSRGQWTSEADTVPGSVTSTSLRKRIYQRKISIPIPLAAALLLALIAVVWFTLHSAKQRVSDFSASRKPQSKPVKIVEVPVERIITRTVYVKGTGRSQSRKNRQKGTTPNLPIPGEHLARQNSKTTESRQRLGAFRPAASANLRVVKDPQQ